ncbi:glucose-6-phosphate isomerase [Pseudoalteromonas tunicata]|uniref:Glucose-6-phosphate isomerase n=1 Tax=Pseudoalteromonas tunicata D2 TaxID=87626 RepID=A4CBC9_9GAMM|nr:glucose-6-phosphate isomerase [Pseudoalteromonas tunicata]ATC94222.1 glucose-6-phosphate isomerase [Pseudoalteromonas tunicata]AXT29979.1 glucose-6-phosphate isomerase [Pseudoalteromonas tunicata]EAR27666.1 glucosephosphate isomerase [Pseudoalteromonas tunicata D2]MDP4985832.1 glucose-6-phosphate isomerase [Pseudoalteromonas tunicata]MDP5211449.1 glucose-6-phosphate isomerase [Pseudoalteromonas tunicata]
MSNRTALPSWQSLQLLAKNIQGVHLKQLFSDDAERFERYSIAIDGLLFDYSKNLITPEIHEQLLALAKDVNLIEWREKMFRGERINFTENRSVLHTALRQRADNPFMLDGENINQAVHTELKKMSVFVEQVRSGAWLGYDNQAITDVVSIGVGGSNLGPQMATEALKPYADDRLNVHYVSNADGVQIHQVLARLNPATTLFVVSSKTFTTSETMTNARTALAWLNAATDVEGAVAKHFVAVSSNLTKTAEFGIDSANVFAMWDWVGGRFSLWSAIGLPIALYLGFDTFTELLAGAADADEHFFNTELSQNIPVIMALLSVWNTSFLGAKAQAILPYDQTMHMLPAYLQQAEMESNGKSVTFAGDSVDYTTVPLIWGMTGINGQHAFYQYLHQGTTIVPADFIGSIEPSVAVGHHHQVLMSNFFAQTQALMNGVDANEVRAALGKKGLSDTEIEQLVAHKVHQGNRPTTSIILDKIDARGLGRLIAFYEHKIFCQGILLEICSFDQWGVELGKGLASNIEAELATNNIVLGHDSSTNGLVNYFKQKRTI